MRETLATVAITRGNSQSVFSLVDGKQGRRFEMRTRKILTFAAIVIAAVMSGCSNGNKQDTHTETSEVVFSRQGGVYDEEF